MRGVAAAMPLTVIVGLSSTCGDSDTNGVVSLSLTSCVSGLPHHRSQPRERGHGPHGQPHPTATSCANRSAGVIHPSVLRGRPLSRAATASSCSWETPPRSVRCGKYCRSSPLVFSLLPRCQGLLGSQKYTCTPLSTVNWTCSADLLALIPGQRAAQLGRQRADALRQRRAHRLGPMAVGQRRRAACTGSCAPPASRSRSRWLPSSRSPSKWPGTARSSTSAGRSLIITISRIWPRPCGAGRPLGRRVR